MRVFGGLILTRAPSEIVRADRLSRCYHEVLRAQLVLAVLALVLAAVMGGLYWLAGVATGAGLAIVNTWFSRRSVQKSSDLAYRDPAVGMLPVFVGLVQRLVLFAAAIGIGLIVWQLPPLGMLGAYLWVQAGYLACRMTTNELKANKKTNK